MPLDVRYWFPSRLIPKHRHHIVNTGLTPRWHDVDDDVQTENDDEFGED